MAADTFPGELDPRSVAPYPPHTVAELADFVGVSEADVLRWLDQGLPCCGDGRIDIFTACNWISWRVLDDVPVLSRRWRWFMGLFTEFVGSGGAIRNTPNRWSWERTHRLLLPVAVDALQWWICDPVPSATQEVEAVDVLSLADVSWDQQAGWQHIALERVEAGILDARGACTVHVRETHLQDQERSYAERIAEEMICFVESFDYGYRLHRPADVFSARSGSCLDACVSFARQLQRVGLGSCQLLGGIVSSTRVANPHYWLVCSDGQHSLPVDPSLPAIARMLRLDWRHWARVYSGACDAQRITMNAAEIASTSPSPSPSPWASQRPACPVPEFISPVPGEAITTYQGEPTSAWRCQDWVQGWTEALIARA